MTPELTEAIETLKGGGELSPEQREVISNHIARIMDPENEREWFEHYQDLGGNPDNSPGPEWVDTYIGPNFLNGKNGEAQRIMREWLSKQQGFKWVIQLAGRTLVCFKRKKWTHECHSTALALAVLETGDE